MNPESRIKLIRSLEEVKLFEETFGRKDSPKTRLFNRFFLIIFYFAWVIFSFDYDFRQRILMLVTMAIPTIAYSMWLSAKNKSDERFKLIANAVLELGSVAQENPITEPLSQKIESKVIKLKKQTVKRKKK